MSVKCLPCYFNVHFWHSVRCSLVSAFKHLNTIKYVNICWRIISFFSLFSFSTKLLLLCEIFFCSYCISLHTISKQGLAKSIAYIWYLHKICALWPQRTHTLFWFKWKRFFCRCCRANVLAIDVVVVLQRVFFFVFVRCRHLFGTVVAVGRRKHYRCRVWVIVRIQLLKKIDEIGLCLNMLL